MGDFKKFNSVTNYLNMLNMMYYVIVGVPLVLFLLLYLQNKDILSINGLISTSQLFIKVGLFIFSIFLIFFGEMKFKSKLKGDFSQHFIESKLHHYFQSSIWRYLAYGIAAFLSVVGLYFYMEGIFVGNYLIILFSFSLIRPTKKSICKAPLFSKEEKEIILKEDIIP